MPTFQICDVQVTYKDQFDWRLIETLGRCLYSLQEPTLTTIVCLPQRNKQFKLKETGIIQLAPGCGLRMEEKILPGTINQKGSNEIIYAPPLHSSISKLSPALQEFQGYLPIGKSMSKQVKEITPKDRAFETNYRSLE